MSHAYIVIMAGGTGTRLWPLSRKGSPKQFQAFTSSQTMIEETFARVKGIVPLENIFVSTTQNHAALVLEQLPEISEKRLILEPESRNTGPAIALVAATLHHHDPLAIVATIASDHAIENTEEFAATIHAGLLAAEQNQDKLVTVGINPTRPDTGLGYIKMGSEFSVIAGKRVFILDTFKEKPDQKTAAQYVTNWEYLWNAGYFIFSAATFAQWTTLFAPALHDTMEKIIAAKTAGTLDEKTLAALYGATSSEPIEPLIVEKLAPEKRLVIPSALRWSDVGNWETLYDFLHSKSGESSIISGNHIDVGSTNLLVHGEQRLIATIGVEDLIIIDTADAILIARRDGVSGDIKKLIATLKETGRQSLL